MAQVVTNDNVMEYIEKRSVPEFVAPSDTPPPDPVPEVKAESVVAETPVEPEDDADLADLYKDLTPAEKAALGEKTRKKFGAKHRQAREALEKAEEADRTAESQYNERKLAEKRAENAERRLAELETKAAPAAPETGTKPNPKDFTDQALFDTAMDTWLDAEIDRKLAVKEAKREAERLDSARRERIAAFAEETPDYVETMEALSDPDKDIQVPGHITQYLMESETSPQLMYHFAKHPDVLERIAKLSPIKGIAEIGKLEVSLEKKAVVNGSAPAPVTPISKAPKPIEAIPESATRISKDPSQMTTDELLAYRDQERRAKH